MAAVMLCALVLGGLLYAAGPRLYLSPIGMSRYVQWVRVSLLSYGGMINTFYVGRGPVNLSASTAIEVKADRAALWRGQAYDRYTGNGWTKDLARTRELIALEDGWLGVPEAQEPRGEMLHQVVTLVDMESRAFYSATRAVKVRAWAHQAGVRTLRYHAQLDPYDSVMTTFMMMPGTEYEVINTSTWGLDNEVSGDNISADGTTNITWDLEDPE